MFSKACEYGIKAMIYIAQQSKMGYRSSLKGIAKAIDSPEAFTAKILQTLSRDELITSVKGAGGGYQIQEKHQGNITLYNIISSIDGEKIFCKCGLGLETCSDAKPCPMHNQFKTIRTDLTNMSKSTTINELANELNFGLTYLKA